MDGDATRDGAEDPITEVPVDAGPAPPLRSATALDTNEASAATAPGLALVGGLSRRATASTATALMSLRRRLRSAASAEPMTLRSAHSDPVGMETFFSARVLKRVGGRGGGMG